MFYRYTIIIVSPNKNQITEIDLWTWFMFCVQLTHRFLASCDKRALQSQNFQWVIALNLYSINSQYFQCQHRILVAKYTRSHNVYERLRQKNSIDGYKSQSNNNFYHRNEEKNYSKPKYSNHYFLFFFFQAYFIDWYLNYSRNFSLSVSYAWIWIQEVDSIRF